MDEKHIIKKNELATRTMALIIELYLSSKNKDWIDQTQPIKRTKYPAQPIRVNKKSATEAPRGPPKLFTLLLELILKKPESETS